MRTPRYIMVKRPDLTDNKRGLIAEHRAVWIDEHGEIPPGAVIHHIDGDNTSNHISNLALVSSNGGHRQLYHSNAEWSNHVDPIAPFDLIDMIFIRAHLPIDRVLRSMP